MTMIHKFWNRNRKNAKTGSGCYPDCSFEFKNLHAQFGYKFPLDMLSHFVVDLPTCHLILFLFIEEPMIFHIRSKNILLVWF